MVVRPHSAFASRLSEACDGVSIVPKERGRARYIAKLMQVSSESARKWLAGESLPSMAHAVQLAFHLDVYVEWLLTGRGPKRIATITAVKQEMPTYTVEGLAIQTLLATLLASFEELRREIAEIKAHLGSEPRRCCLGGRDSLGGPVK